MLAVVAITFLYLLFIWVVFFKLKWLRLTPTWGVVSGFFLLHLVLVPMVGMRFFAPLSTDLRVVRHTVQIVPRLPEPTLVEAILVAQNQPVEKGTPLFVLDKRPYQYQLDQAKAALAAAKQNVLILQADVAVAAASVERAKAELAYKREQEQRFVSLAAQRAAPKEDAQRWTAEVVAGEAAVAEAQANKERAEVAYASQIDGVNTVVAEAESQVAEAEYYLEQTVIRAPEDGMIVNLQVQEGMVAGIVRAGAIASFIVERDPYLLATYRQENLKFVQEGQPVVVALNPYPGEHFSARVEEIWWASGRGQFLPSGELPVFPDQPSAEVRFPVKITMDDPTVRLPIGAEGAALILTNDGPFTWLGQIALRTYTWSRWLYPLPF
ncbi:MAG: biotin/lipoyl-binding protein [Geminicoccaceae bacterium]